MTHSDCHCLCEHVHDVRDAVRFVTLSLSMVSVKSVLASLLAAGFCARLLLRLAQARAFVRNALHTRRRVDAHHRQFLSYSSTCIVSASSSSAQESARVVRAKLLSAGAPARASAPGLVGWRFVVSCFVLFVCLFACLSLLLFARLLVGLLRLVLCFAQWTCEFSLTALSTCSGRFFFRSGESVLS